MSIGVLAHFIGVMIVLVAIVATFSKVEVDWDEITDKGGLVLFLTLYYIIPIPLMIYGVVVDSLWVIILAEVTTAIFTGFMASWDIHGRPILVLMIPTAICFVDFLILDQFIGTVIVLLVALGQFSAVVKN